MDKMDSGKVRLYIDGVSFSNNDDLRNFISYEPEKTKTVERKQHGIAEEIVIRTDWKEWNKD